MKIKFFLPVVFFFAACENKSRNTESGDRKKLQTNAESKSIKKFKKVFFQNCTSDLKVYIQGDSVFIIDEVYNAKSNFNPIKFSFHKFGFNKDTVYRIESRIIKGQNKYDSIYKKMNLEKSFGIDFRKYKYVNDTIKIGEEIIEIAPNLKSAKTFKFKRAEDFLFYWFLDTSGGTEHNINLYNRVTKESVFGRVETTELDKPIFLLYDFIGDSTPEVFVFGTTFETQHSQASYLEIYSVQ